VDFISSVYDQTSGILSTRHLCEVTEWVSKNKGQRQNIKRADLRRTASVSPSTKSEIIRPTLAKCTVSLTSYARRTERHSSEARQPSTVISKKDSGESRRVTKGAIIHLTC